MRKIIHIWIFTAVIVTLICGIIYLVVQQNYRQTANDPQIEIAQDISSALASGEPPASIGTPSFDLNQSLSPFIAIYDSSGKPLAFTATLDGNPPSMPAGIFDNVKKNGEQRFTWQPRSGIREALVVTSFNDQGDKTSGFVVAGKSLVEIEKRETSLGLEVGAGWLFTLLLTFGMLWGYEYATGPRQRKQKPEINAQNGSETPQPPQAEHKV